MPPVFHHCRFFAAILLLTNGFLVSATAAQSQEFKVGEDPVSVIMKWRPTTPDPEVKDFVKASRPEAPLDYKPITGPKVERPKLKSKKELKAGIGDLDTKGGAVRQRGAAAFGGANNTARQLQSAGAEAQRRAAQDFAGTK